MLSTGPDGTARAVAVPVGVRWSGSRTETADGAALPSTALRPAASRTAPLTVAYGTGNAPGSDAWASGPPEFTVRLDTARATPPAPIAAVATRAFLRAAGTEPGREHRHDAGRGAAAGDDRAVGKRAADDRRTARPGPGPARTRREHRTERRARAGRTGALCCWICAP